MGGINDLLLSASPDGEVICETLEADNKDMTPALSRAVRTLLQGAVAALGTLSLNTLFKGVDPVMIGGFQVALTAMVSQLQNALEDSGTVPMLLKPKIVVEPLPLPAPPPPEPELVAPPPRPRKKAAPAKRPAKKRP